MYMSLAAVACKVLVLRAQQGLNCPMLAPAQGLAATPTHGSGRVTRLADACFQSNHIRDFAKIKTTSLPSGVRF